ADFSGTWTLDTAKSDPAPQGRGGGGGAASVTIKQTGNELSVTSEGRQGPQTMTYKLDGSESTNQVMGRGGAQSVKSTAKWDGSNLVIETTREFQGTPITTKEVRRLDNGGDGDREQHSDPEWGAEAEDGLHEILTSIA